MKKQLVIIALFLISLCAVAESEEKELFKLIDKPIEHIQAERKAALKEGKLLLWALGGNWCHDSVSLANKLASDELKPIIEKHFRLSSVSVGYLNSGFEYTQVANMATFYATPTVLIIDPVTMQQLNHSDMHIWANAYNVPLEEAVDYFKRYSVQKSSQHPALSRQQKALMNVLDDFVRTQEQRIRASYQVVGPLLEEYKAGVTNPEFEKSWQALAKLRMALPEIIDKNRELIINNADTELNFSAEELKPLPWETDL